MENVAPTLTRSPQIGHAIQAHGISLRPWHRDVLHQMFHWHQFDGLILPTELCITIVAINSEEPGSGKLGLLMERFENAADDERIAIVVVHFWNARLWRWFGRRGYAIAECKQFGKYALREYA